MSVEFHGVVRSGLHELTIFKLFQQIVRASSRLSCSTYTVARIPGFIPVDAGQ